MKVQRGGNWNGLSPAKQADSLSGNFKEIMASSLKSDSPDIENAECSTVPEAHPIFIAERPAEVKRVDIHKNMLYPTDGGLKELVRDVFYGTPEMIRREVDSLCDDETGEGIDMTQLDEFLDLEIALLGE